MGVRCGICCCVMFDSGRAKRVSLSPGCQKRLTIGRAAQAPRFGPLHAEISSLMLRHVLSLMRTANLTICHYDQGHLVSRGVAIIGVSPIMEGRGNVDHSTTSRRAAPKERK